jgi:cytochrome c peroxidase
MKYAALTCSILLLITSLTLTVAEDPPVSSPTTASATPRQAGAKFDLIEEYPRFGEKERQQKCPPSPQPKDWLMIPHGGLHTEGCERVTLQDLETDFDSTQLFAEELRREMLKQQPTWTPERTARAQQEGARGIVTEISQIVRNEEAAIALGKAFFWDMQVGSDGQTACASCHFKAGADGRADGSKGVARRVLKKSFTVDEFGTETNEEFEDASYVKIYRNRWNKMVPFNTVVYRLAIHGLERLIEIANERSFGMADVLKEMGDDTLSTNDPEIKRLWDTLKEAISATPQKPTPAELVTRIKLVVYALDYLKETKSGKADTPENLDKRLGRVFSPYQQSIDELRVEYEEKRKLTPDQNPPLPNEKQDPKFLTRETDLPNAPTVINSALHDRLFHDGRAASVFNGYDHLGDEAGRDGFGKWTFRNGAWRRVLVRIPDAALASQATAPLLSVAEMSWFGRQYHHVARKLLDRNPLKHQKVKTDDSHLAGYVAEDEKGLLLTYRELIKKAFRPEWWSGETVPKVDECDALTGDKLTLSQLEANFSLFWGVALMAYQKELISNQSEFDRLMSKRRQGISLFDPAKPDENARIRTVLTGFKTFQDHACADCHRAPEFAGATRATVYGPILEFEGPLDAINAETEENEFAGWLQVGKPGLDVRIERMPFRADLAPRFYDSGFYNIGVTPDHPLLKKFHPGVAGEIRMDMGNQDGALLSIVQRFGQGLVSDLLLDRKPYVTHSLARRHNDRFSNVVGSFKTSTMRNIAITGPYFHNGKTPTLSMVLEHYHDPSNNVKSGPVGTPDDNDVFLRNKNLHPAVTPVDGEPAETDVPDSLRPGLIEFLNSLTDHRVLKGEAPFDHPSLKVPILNTVDKNGRTPDAGMKDTKEL